MLDPTILQFLAGAIGGIGVSVASSRKTKGKPRGRRTRRKGGSRVQRRTRQSKGRTSALASIEPEKVVADVVYQAQRAELQPIRASFGPTPDLSSTANEKTSVGDAVRGKAASISVCPSCGLEGSSSLLSEHFLSSPSHPLGKKEQPLQNHLGENKAAQGLEEHHTGLIRNLLSVLVPPRAFGRRHLQVESSLPGFVQASVSRSRSTRSTKPLMLSIDN